MPENRINYSYSQTNSLEKHDRFQCSFIQWVFLCPSHKKIGTWLTDLYFASLNVYYFRLSLLLYIMALLLVNVKNEFYGIFNTMNDMCSTLGKSRENIWRKLQNLLQIFPLQSMLTHQIHSSFCTLKYLSGQPIENHQNMWNNYHIPNLWLHYGSMQNRCEPLEVTVDHGETQFKNDLWSYWVKFMTPPLPSVMQPKKVLNM